MEYGFKEITEDPYYSSVDWEALERQQVKPPYVPQVKDNHDFGRFPEEFTNELVQLTPENGRREKIDQSEFEMFEYLNPSAKDVWTHTNQRKNLL